jgi:hypothetical protein
MALFALWRADVTAPVPVKLVHARLAAASHVDPALTVATTVQTRTGLWHLAAFATRTHFYAPEDQVHLDPDGGACVIHGLIWRADAARPRPLRAAEIAPLLDRPDATLPDDMAGEYAIARLLPCGTLLAFGDPAGLHQLFHRDGRGDVVANRAGFVAALAGTDGIDPQAGAWIATIGYRVGPATAWQDIRQLEAGSALVNGRTVPLTRRMALPPGPRGYTHGGDALLEQGMAQASAAIRMSVPDGATIDLPLTGGKDSRAVLALCLRAGLRDRLRTFTRGYADSPDAIAAAMLAAVAGVPHRREPPLGSDEPVDLTLDEFHRNFARLAFQTDGGMGGWDMITGRTAGTETLLTGHMGEVLKAYSKRALPAELDPVTLVRLQAPFDPLAILRPEARARMVEQLAAGMAAERQAGAWEADLPDLFYLRHRIPNWLGGIRGIKSFERQPVLPLGVPALAELAFRMTPEERRAELAHYTIVRAGAPELLALPFAHQTWDGSLPDAPQIDPVLVPAGKPLFGNWQYSLNARPEIRAHLAQLFASTDLALWDWIDRDAVVERLQHRPIDYFDGISLLGLTVTTYHAAGLLLTERLAAPDASAHGEVSCPPPPFRDAVLEVAW